MEWLPACAMENDSRTVRTRLRSDVSSGRRPDVTAKDAVSCLSPRILRRDSCSGCRRERERGSSANVIVPKVQRVECRRRCRGSCTVYNKYVRAAAVTCLLLVLGGLCPASSAAPATSDARRLDRSRRWESMPTWRNPCGAQMAAENGGGGGAIDKRSPIKLQRLARVIRDKANMYQELFAGIKQTMNFNTTMQRFGQTPSILSHSWYDVPQKELGGPLRERHYKEENLPGMYKYLELLIGAVETIATAGSFSDAEHPDLRKHLDKTLELLKQLLCEFDVMLMNRNIKKLPSLEPSEVPARPGEDSLGNLNDFLIFRDTLNFLEIMEIVFRDISLSEQ